MRLSVLMSVYYKDRPEYLYSALNSIASQTVKASEVVLVEDGYIADSLKNVINDFRNILNIKSVKLSENKGLSTALNEGLKHCSNELIARMDSDDISLPNRFEVQIDYMNANHNVSVCSAYIEEVDDALNVTSIRKLPIEHSEIVKFAKYRSPISHPVVFFKKSAILSVGGYPSNYPEDHLLWCILIKRGFIFANIPIILLRMRASNAVLTRRGYKFLLGEIRSYRKMKDIGFINHYVFIKNVFLRTVLRLSPKFIKILLYKYMRR